MCKNVFFGTSVDAPFLSGGNSEPQKCSHKNEAKSANVVPIRKVPQGCSASKEKNIIRISRASDFFSLVDRMMGISSRLSLSLAITSVVFGLSTAQFCIESINEIYISESQVVDTSQRRKYVLCPRRIFEVGTLNHNFELQGFNVNSPLPLRPNITIQCGDTGSRENMCWIQDGDLQMDATPFRGIADATVEGVELTGLVFIGATKYSIWATKPGDITFRDCEWREHTKSVVPIMLDWFDGSSSQLSVTFDGCDFLVSTLLTSSLGSFCTGGAVVSSQRTSISGQSILWSRLVHVTYIRQR